jgi:hypothetical protein
MELLGMVMLRITDQEFSKIRVLVDNKDQRGLQFQVYTYYLSFTPLRCSTSGYSRCMLHRTSSVNAATLRSLG